MAKVKRDPFDKLIRQSWRPRRMPSAISLKRRGVRRLSGVGGVLGDTYYVDATGGDDAKSGSAPNTAWQTVAKVNASAFKPGDQILFKRGETWRGENLVVPSSGAADRPITFGAYGSGPNPLIDPSVEYNDFTLDAGSVWKRTHAGVDLYQVFQDGARMIYSATRAAMVQGSFAYEGGVVYVWCSDNGNPNTGHVIDYCTSQLGVAVKFNGKSHLIFDSLDVKKPNYTAYNTDLGGSSNIVVRSCEVSWAGIRSVLIGVDISGVRHDPTDVTVSNCVGHDDLDLSFWIGRGTRLIVEDCETYNSGLDLSPRAKNYPAATHFANGILISGDAVDCIVRDNYVHDTYENAGIMDELSVGLHSSGCIIERNLVDTVVSGVIGISVAGINTTVRNNIVLHAAGKGVEFVNTPTSPLFYHNTLVNSTGSGRSIEGVTGTGIAIKNNIVVRQGVTERFVSIVAAAGTGCVIDSNEYFQINGTPRWFWGPTAEHTSFAAWQGNPGDPDTNGLSSDPVFVAPYTDLHLQTTSPCKNAGVDVGVTNDYDGRARPMGAAVDIGAYEFVE